MRPLSLCLLLLLPPLALAQPGQGRGYVEPRGADQLQAAMVAQQSGPLGHLPLATAKKYDCSAMLPPIESQGQCGSCWLFAGKTACEGALCQANGGRPQSLSAQYFMSCPGGHGGCNGDWPATVLEHARTHGLPLTSDYGPYVGQRTACEAKEGLAFFRLSRWGFVEATPGVASTQRLKDCMQEFGPLSVAVAAGDGWGRYSGGVHRGGSRQVNHAVVLTGWDDDMLPGRTVWRLRNSWGSSWGEGGNMWIEEGADQVGTRATYAAAEGRPRPVPPRPTPILSFLRWVGFMAFVLAVGAVLGILAGWWLRRWLRTS